MKGLYWVLDTCALYVGRSRTCESNTAVAAEKNGTISETCLQHNCACPPLAHGSNQCHHDAVDLFTPNVVCFVPQTQMALCTVTRSMHASFGLHNPDILLTACAERSDKYTVRDYSLAGGSSRSVSCAVPGHSRTGCDTGLPHKTRPCAPCSCYFCARGSPVWYLDASVMAIRRCAKAFLCASPMRRINLRIGGTNVL